MDRDVICLAEWPADRLIDPLIEGGTDILIYWLYLFICLFIYLLMDEGIDHQFSELID